MSPDTWRQQLKIKVRLLNTSIALLQSTYDFPLRLHRYSQWNQFALTFSAELYHFWDTQDRENLRVKDLKIRCTLFFFCDILSETYSEASALPRGLDKTGARGRVKRESHEPVALFPCYNIRVYIGKNARYNYNIYKYSYQGNRLYILHETVN